jgi:hypothetical protein
VGHFDREMKCITGRTAAERAALHGLYSVSEHRDCSLFHCRDDTAGLELWRVIAVTPALSCETCAGQLDVDETWGPIARRADRRRIEFVNLEAILLGGNCDAKSLFFGE